MQLDKSDPRPKDLETQWIKPLGGERGVYLSKLVQEIFHEFVHVKQDRNLDKFKNVSFPEDEFEAYYQEASNKDLPQLKADVNKNWEYGWTPVFTYLINDKYYRDAKGNPLDPAVLRQAQASMVEKYKKQILFLTTKMTEDGAKNLKARVEAKTGVKLE